jgi:hypothetical protein
MEEVMMRARLSIRSKLHQNGWSTTEYLAVLLGLMSVWSGAQAVLMLARQHHDEFSWALMIPL